MRPYYWRKDSIEEYQNILGGLIKDGNMNRFSIRVKWWATKNNRDPKTIIYYQKKILKGLL